LCSFQLPLRIRKKAIWTPKITAAVDSEAAKFSMLWFWFRRAAPEPLLLVDDEAGALVDVADMVLPAEGCGGAGCADCGDAN